MLAIINCTHEADFFQSLKLEIYLTYFSTSYDIGRRSVFKDSAENDH